MLAASNDSKTAFFSGGFSEFVQDEGAVRHNWEIAYSRETPYAEGFGYKAYGFRDGC